MEQQFTKAADILLATHTDHFGTSIQPHEKGVAAQAVGLLVFLAISLAAGWLGSVATMPNIPNWYADLEKPFFTPPNAVFPIVWTVLYVLMGIAAWLVWRKDAIGADKTAALSAFFVQLALNVAWSWAFFGAHNPLLGLGIIVLLMIAILWMLAAFRIVSRLAAALMVPYLAWVAFATAPNAGIYVLNG